MPFRNPLHGIKQPFGKFTGVREPLALAEGTVDELIKLVAGKNIRQCQYWHSCVEGPVDLGHDRKLEKSGRV